MIVSVDAGSPVPVYEQVRAQVTRMVAAGTMPGGTRLPTIRQLATDLGLAKGTVARAYEMLENDGVIATRGRRGSFVLELPSTADTEASAEALAAAADSMMLVARQLGVDLETVNRAVDAAWERFPTS